MRTLWIVIPAKDEAATIADLVAEAAHYGTVLVVTSGPSDDTGPRAASAGAQVIYNGQSIAGKIVTGWQRALDNNATRVIVMDAGGSHRPSDIPRLLAAEADIVIGSRFVAGGQYHGRSWRRVCSQVMALLCNLAQPGKQVHDWSSGFRCYSVEAIGQLLAVHYKSDMHAWQIEVLGWARRLHLSVEEVPIQYTAGHSSLSWDGALRALNILLDILLRRWVVG